MKKLILIIAVSFLTLNCSNDENDTPNDPGNETTIIGEGKYSINSIESPTNYAYWYGASSEATFTLTNVKLNSQSEVFYNKSDSIWFDLRPQETETVNSGTYIFSKSGGFPKYIQDGMHNADEFTGGTVTISQNGTKYNVSYDITTQSGKNIIGSYSGVINIVK